MLSAAALSCAPIELASREGVRVTLRFGEDARPRVLTSDGAPAPARLRQALEAALMEVALTQHAARSPARASRWNVARVTAGLVAIITLRDADAGIEEAPAQLVTLITRALPEALLRAPHLAQELAARVAEVT